MNPNDYDEDGNNIVPCPICLSNHCPSKEDGKCPEEEEFARDMQKQIGKSLPTFIQQREGELLKLWDFSHKYIDGTDPRENVKRFHRESLRLQLEALVREVEGRMKPKHDWQKDEHGKRCVDGCTYCSHAEGMTVGNNSALSDLTAHLQAQINELKNHE